MKKLFVALSLLGAIAAVNAQPAPAPEHPLGAPMHQRTIDPSERAAHLQKTLQLSDEQTAKVKKVFENSEQQRKALEEKYKPQFEAFHADAKNLRDQTDTQLNGILTPKQQQALAAQREHGGKFARGMGRKGEWHDEEKTSAK